MIGKTIGNYRIVEKLGKGATGTVFKALDETLGREVAIKVLHPDLAETEVMKRFRTEVKALARLGHPEIATIHDVQISADAVLLVTELVRGENLDALVKRLGPLPAERAAIFTTQVLSALAHAHQVDVVHRDLKPTNVMVTELGTVKLLDFAMAPVEGAAQMTAASFALGTPAYMAPERILGNEVDARADIYSVGVILYYLLTGRVPFEAPSATEMAQKQIGEAPTPLASHRPDLPSWCQAVIDRALAKAPDDRFQAAADFRAALLDGVSSSSSEVTGMLPVMHVAAADTGTLPAASAPPPSAPPAVDPDAATMLTAIPGAAVPAPDGDDPTAPVDVDPMAATVLTAMPPMPGDAATLAAAPLPSDAWGGEPTIQGSRLTDLPDAAPTIAGRAVPAGIGGDAPTMLVPAATAPTVAAPLEALVETATAPTPASGGTLVMKRRQFAAVGATLAALALAVVVIVVVVVSRSSDAPAGAPVVAQADPVPAATPAPSAPATPASVPLSDPPPAVAPPPPMEIAEPAIRTAPARPRAARPTEPAATEPAAPAPINPALANVTVTTPFTFAGKAVVIDGDRRRERDASVTLVDGAVNVTFSDGKGAYSVPIGNLIGVTYSNSRQPLWQSPTGPAEAMRVEGGGFLRGRRNWFGVRTPDSLMVLRVEDDIVGRVIAGVQERTGLTVARLVEPKQ